MYNYRNPFEEYDSNVMTSEKISDLFTEPYDSFPITESMMIEDKSPIVIIGARGSGKTMLLRQFSYNVQSITQNRSSYLNRVNEKKYVGIYFRVDKPMLRRLDEISSNYSVEDIFSHFFELTIFKEYLEIIKILERDAGVVKGDSKYVEILNELIQLFPVPRGMIIDSIDQFLTYVIDEINYIWSFLSKKSIDINNSVKFEPSCNIIFQGRLSDEFCNTKVMRILGLDDIAVLLLLDEYESFTEKQQKVINAAMRYNKNYGVRLRIGMRPNGFKTFETVNSTDFIKEDRDYTRIEFDNPLLKKQNDKKYFKLVENIAKKRLGLIPMFEGKSIVDILGKEENLEEEAKAIVKGKTKHFDAYLKEINKKRGGINSLTIKALKGIRDDNPLYEMECLRLLLRGESVKYVEKALSDYKSGVKSSEAQKFKNDYDNKYKLSFVLVLCSIYKVERKGYYGFSDYCYISSGIIGAFIALCRRAFDIAYFKEPDSLRAGKIANYIQTQAAYEFSYSERDMISRISCDGIEDCGNKLMIFINNIGNVFSRINRDLLLRYPETNMFPVRREELNAECRKLLDLAYSWSLVIKKPTTLDDSEEGMVQDVYLINRVFAPAYKISYRTRGGLNPIKKLTDDYFLSSFRPESVLKDDDYVDEKQMSIFDLKR